MLLWYGGLILLLIGMTTGARFLNSDVLYQDGFWVVALDVAIAIADLLAFVVSAVVVIYGIYLIGCREMMTVYSAYLSLTVLLNVAKVCIGWIIFPGTLPKTPEELITVLLESLVFIVLIDCLRLFIIGFITTKQLAKHEHQPVGEKVRQCNERHLHGQLVDASLHRDLVFFFYFFCCNTFYR